MSGIQEEVAKQRYSPRYTRHRGNMTQMPDQIMEMESVGWIRAHHVGGVNISGIADAEGKAAQVMVLTYTGGSGDGYGMGMFGALPCDFARKIAASINHMCDLIEAGASFADFGQRPPAEEAI